MTNEKKRSLNLYQKLVEIRKAVPYVKKTAEGHRYVYAPESQILGAIREQMDTQGVLLLQDFLECIPGQKGLLFKIEYTWINAENPEERLQVRQFMTDEGFDAKKVGAIMTYSMRYFLLKFLNVPTDKDDIDVFQNKVEANKKRDTLSEDQARYLTGLIPEGNKGLYDYIVSHYRVKAFTEIPSDQYGIVEGEIRKQIMMKEAQDAKN